MNQFRNQTGFSYVQVLVSVALLSVIVFSVMKIQGNATNAQRGFYTSFAIGEEVLNIERMLMDPVACDNTVASINLPGNLILPGTTTSNVLIMNRDNVNAVVVGDITRWKDFIVTNVEVQRGSNIAGSNSPWPTNLLHFRVTFIPKSETIGVQQISKTFKVHARFNPSNLNQVIGCYTQHTAIRDTVMELTCLELKRGLNYIPRDLGVPEECEANPDRLSVASFFISGNGSTFTTTDPYNYCGLTTMGGEDGYKDSSEHACTVTKLADDTWRLDAFEEEARSIRCKMTCFSFNPVGVNDDDDGDPPPPPPPASNFLTQMVMAICSKLEASYAIDVMTCISDIDTNTEFDTTLGLPNGVYADLDAMITAEQLGTLIPNPINAPDCVRDISNMTPAEVNASNSYNPPLDYSMAHNMPNFWPLSCKAMFP